MRRILVVNSNTSDKATRQIAAALQPYLSQGTEVRCVNSDAGPQGIDTLLDMAIAAVETVRVIVRNIAAYDAFIVGCGADPGLDVARQLTHQPVLGIAEAGMLMACPLGAKFSILTGARSEIPSLLELVAHYGLTSRLASTPVIGMTTADFIDEPDEMYRRLLAAARKAIDEDMAEVIVLTGSVMGGLAFRMSDELGAPVVPGLICALKLAEDMIDLGLKTSHSCKYRSVIKRDRLIGYEDLQEVYSAKDPQPTHGPTT